jgi:hypothetical protein
MPVTTQYLPGFNISFPHPHVPQHSLHLGETPWSLVLYNSGCTTCTVNPGTDEQLGMGVEIASSNSYDVAHPTGSCHLSDLVNGTPACWARMRRSASPLRDSNVAINSLVCRVKLKYERCPSTPSFKGKSQNVKHGH